jgi:LEA14-like dessication related protein
LEVPVEVANPNAFALPVSSVAGAFSVAGVKVGSLATGDLGKLEPGAKRTVVLPVTFDLLRAASAAVALRMGTAALAFDGTLQTGQLTVPVKWAETVQLAR